VSAVGDLVPAVNQNGSSFGRYDIVVSLVRAAWPTSISRGCAASRRNSMQQCRLDATPLKAMGVKRNLGSVSTIALD
jgi:hypothetical protein